MTEFERDLDACRRDLRASREQLLGVVRTMSDADLERGKRGQWTVRRTLEHVIFSELAYARLLLHLRGLPVPADAIEASPASAADALERLDGSHRALHEAFEGVDEDAFYRLATIGHEEYSVVSLLENSAMHDREHAQQLRDILAR